MVLRLSGLFQVFAHQKFSTPTERDEVTAAAAAPPVGLRRLFGATGAFVLSTLQATHWQSVSLSVSHHARGWLADAL